jgi:hypothetical protein
MLLCSHGLSRAQGGISLDEITTAARNAERLLSLQDLKRVDNIEPQILKQFPPTQPERGSGFYNFSSVQDMLTTARQTLEKPLLDRLPLVPLRDYIQRFYPNLAPQAVPPVGPAGGAGGRASSTSFVTEEAATSAVTRARGVTNAIRSMSSLSLDVSVRTTPAQQAVIKLQARDGTRYSGTSDTDFKGVYRGLYVYTVSKDGMKTITDDLNLVVDSRRVMECTLSAVDMPGGPYPCNRK